MNIFDFLGAITDLGNGEVERRIVQKARDYIDNRTYRADFVQALPASAPVGYLMVTGGGDTNLYIGAGAGNPLRRIPTQALP